MNNSSIYNQDLHIRPTTAKAVVKAVELLYSVDAVDYCEVQTIRMVLNSLARSGGLPHEPEKRLLDIHEVATKLAVGESTLKRLLSEGAINLPKIRIGGAVRFRLGDVERLMDEIEDEDELRANKGGAMTSECK